MTRSTGAAKFARVGAMMTLAVGLVVIPGQVAYAACTPHASPNDAVGGKESSQVRLGAKADVLVNAFGQDQTNTWRSVTVWQDDMFSAEVGWFVKSSYDQYPHPYQTRVNNGITRTVDRADLSVLPQGILHTFKVHDQNHDHQWSFAYDGNALGNLRVDFDWGRPLFEAERKCADDSLYAQFRTLQQVGCTNCGWSPLTSLSMWVQNPISNFYYFCLISTTSFDVKQVC
jgi:hypothetical protein